jgi:hypothetical protein
MLTTQGYGILREENIPEALTGYLRALVKSALEMLVFQR